MAKVFQPKVIIGSVCGIIASVVGFIAIFFPSLFNLETKKIDEYKAFLAQKEDAVKLYSFLKEHQETIIKLELTYKETKLYKVKFVKNKEGEEEYKEENILICGDGGSSGDEGLGIVDKEGIFFVCSSYIIKPFCDNVFRNKGGLGVWVSGITENPENDDIALQIVIPKDSNGNKLYQWSYKDDKQAQSDSGIEMRISGTFFVNKFVSSKDYTGEVMGVMSPQWGEINVSESGDNINSTQVVELEPLSKKELEMKNY